MRYRSTSMRYRLVRCSLAALHRDRTQRILERGIAVALRDGDTAQRERGLRVGRIDRADLLEQLPRLREVAPQARLLGAAEQAIDVPQARVLLARREIGGRLSRIEVHEQQAALEAHPG